MNRKTLISIAVFLSVVGYATYLVLDIESLTAREVEFIDRLETDIAQALEKTPANSFRHGVACEQIPSRRLAS